MPPHIELLDLGTAVTDVLAFLGPADQHKLRCTSAAMCEWFDSAAENGSLAFFVTFAPPPSAAAAGHLRWRHATADPRDTRHKTAYNLTPPATVTVHARNYCLSTYNKKVCDDAIIDNAAIELVADFAFEHKLVVTGLFGIRSVGDGFCMKLKAVEVEFRGEDSEVRSVGNGWMSYCANLRSVTFAGFAALEEVGNNWMLGCSSLDCIAFAGGMSNLKEVGNFWMTSCPNLKHVDLARFTALEEVGGSWLYSCSSLESIAFAGDMSRLRKVGNSWMASCPKLEHVDFTGCTALEEAGHCWMYDCSGLESITFASDMSQLKRVGDYWISKCPKLKQVDLAGFTALEEVGSGWLSSCLGLESIAFAPKMPKLKKVGNYWMSKCSNLKQLDLAGFTALEEVGDNWISMCPKLKQVDLTGLIVLEEVGRNWLSNCMRLESISFPSEMPKLRKVGNFWMSNCSKLKQIDLTGSAALEEFGLDEASLAHLKSLLRRPPPLPSVQEKD